MIFALAISYLVSTAPFGESAKVSAACSDLLTRVAASSLVEIPDNKFRLVDANLRDSVNKRWIAGTQIPADVMADIINSIRMDSVASFNGSFTIKLVDHDIGGPGPVRNFLDSVHKTYISKLPSYKERRFFKWIKRNQGGPPMIIPWIALLPTLPAIIFQGMDNPETFSTSIGLAAFGFQTLLFASYISYFQWKDTISQSQLKWERFYNQVLNLLNPSDTGSVTENPIYESEYRFKGLHRKIKMEVKWELGDPPELLLTFEQK